MHTHTFFIFLLYNNAVWMTGRLWAWLHRNHISAHLANPAQEKWKLLRSLHINNMKWNFFFFDERLGSSWGPPPREFFFLISYVYDLTTVSSGWNSFLKLVDDFARLSDGKKAQCIFSHWRIYSNCCSYPENSADFMGSILPQRNFLKWAMNFSLRPLQQLL